MYYSTIYDRMHTALQAKTGWGRNEVLDLLGRVLCEVADEELSRTQPPPLPEPSDHYPHGEAIEDLERFTERDLEKLERHAAAARKDTETFKNYLRAIRDEPPDAQPPQPPIRQRIAEGLDRALSRMEQRPSQQGNHPDTDNPPW